MKTKEVIRLLQECDPTGEEEVLVGNHDILDINREPAYYDGCAQIMVRDMSKSCYNIVGAKWIGHGAKISIQSIGIREAIHNNPDLPVEIEIDRERYLGSVNKWRQETREIIDRIEKRIKNRKENE